MNQDSSLLHGYVINFSLHEDSLLDFLSPSLILLGGYDKEEKAARAYDLAALKYWGPTTTTNFPVTTVSQILACIYLFS